MFSARTSGGLFISSLAIGKAFGVPQFRRGRRRIAPACSLASRPVLRYTGGARNDTHPGFQPQKHPAYENAIDLSLSRRSPRFSQYQIGQEMKHRRLAFAVAVAAGAVAILLLLIGRTSTIATAARIQLLKGNLREKSIRTL